MPWCASPLGVRSAEPSHAHVHSDGRKPRDGHGTSRARLTALPRTRTRGAARSARRPVKPEAAGSNPVGSANTSLRDRRSCAAPHGRIAQLAERAPEKREVTGSTPVPTTVSFWLLGPQPHSLLRPQGSHLAALGASAFGLRWPRSRSASSLVSSRLFDSRRRRPWVRATRQPPDTSAAITSPCTTANTRSTSAADGG
jgi:hypothetical protein